jgi:hypothetical protein
MGLWEHETLLPIDHKGKGLPELSKKHLKKGLCEKFHK